MSNIAVLPAASLSCPVPPFLSKSPSDSPVTEEEEALLPKAAAAWDAAKATAAKASMVATASESKETSKDGTSEGISHVEDGDSDEEYVDANDASELPLEKKLKVGRALSNLIFLSLNPDLL